MAASLAETIFDLSLKHCDGGGLIMGQNLEAVQNVCGTVPVEHENVKIMPTCEAAGIGMAIGAALTGRPVIHVIRFASFLWLQSSPIVYYAARAKRTWGYDLPLFIRVSSDDGIGPTHSGAYHSPFVHMPGLKVVAPMTPNEWRDVWVDFQETRQPVLVSEQRRSYALSCEMPNDQSVAFEDYDVLIVAMSGARFDAIEAAEILEREEGVYAEIYHVWNLKPTDGEWRKIWQRARGIGRVLIVDSTFEPCSVAEHFAYKLKSMDALHDYRVSVLGMREAPGITSVGGPTAEQIVNEVMGID